MYTVQEGVHVICFICSDSNTLNKTEFIHVHCTGGVHVIWFVFSDSDTLNKTKFVYVHCTGGVHVIGFVFSDPEIINKSESKIRKLLAGIFLSLPMKASMFAGSKDLS